MGFFALPEHFLEAFKTLFALYHSLLSSADMNNKFVLEINRSFLLFLMSGNGEYRRLCKCIFYEGLSRNYYGLEGKLVQLSTHR